MEMTLTNRKHVALWLFTCCILVGLLVWIGGMTRLTESGLSIVEWKPVTGILPPLNTSEWQQEFSNYQQSPEYKQINHGINLEQFKSLFAFEYIHRLLARLVVLVFLIPFIYFTLSKKLSPPMITRCSIIFVLFCMQGVIGWLMVKSGLINNPHVSQYRLAMHLGMAFIIFGVILWNALTLWRVMTIYSPLKSPLRSFSKLLVDMVFLQILSGALMAKTYAGHIYNTFPLMDGRLIPKGLMPLSPWYKSLFEDVTTIQFTHRLMAGLIFLTAMTIFAVSRRGSFNILIKNAVNIMAIVILVQIGLGITTLVNDVPIALASAHQMGALIVFTAVINLSHILTYRHKLLL